MLNDWYRVLTTILLSFMLKVSPFPFTVIILGLYHDYVTAFTSSLSGYTSCKEYSLAFATLYFY